MFSELVCPELCNACRHKKLPDTESREQKTVFLQKKLQDWKSLIEPLVAPVMRYNYRKKVLLHTFFDERGWNFGMFSQKKIIPVPFCPVQHESINHTIRILTETLPPAGIFPMRFFIQSGKQVILVLKSNQQPDDSWLSSEVINKLKRNGVEGLIIHLNPSAGHKIFMKHNYHLLFGCKYSVDEQGMQYGALSFQQLITGLSDATMNQVLSFLQPGPNSLVVDLYSGTGSSLKLWNRSGAVTTGVELNGEAVECARHNVPGIPVFRGKCSERIPQLNQLIDQHKNKERFLYLNPPRSGAEPEIIRWILKEYQPARIAYLSCSAGTLARNLSVLCSEHYEVKKIIPYDYFPNTHHVECLVMLEKK